MNAAPQESSVPAIVGARLSDLASIRWLLDIGFLPSADITAGSLEHFLVYRDQLGVAGEDFAASDERKRPTRFDPHKNSPLYVHQRPS
jgi:hypothetical protein